MTVHRPKLLSEGYPKKPKSPVERLKKYRMDMGLFQKDVAKLIGVATDTIMLWEKKRTKPYKRNMDKIVHFLEIKGE